MLEITDLDHTGSTVDIYLFIYLLEIHSIDRNQTRP